MHILAEVDVGLGMGFTTTEAAITPVHPLASVTSTLYVAEAVGVTTSGFWFEPVLHK
jgi:hypothetical protein